MGKWGTPRRPGRGRDGGDNVVRLRRGQRIVSIRRSRRAWRMPPFGLYLVVGALVFAMVVALRPQLLSNLTGSNANSAQVASGSCIAADLVGCYDGDTCRAIFEGEERRVRLLGFDTPELDRGARCPLEQTLALQARDRLRYLISVARHRQFCPNGEDRHGRVLAVLLLDGRDVAETMIAEGLARPYHGGPRDGWCG